MNYQYYVPRKIKRATHVFDGTDTLCTMLSTGGLKRIDKYDLVEDCEHHPNHRRICAMCNARLS